VEHINRGARVRYTQIVVKGEAHTNHGGGGYTQIVVDYEDEILQKMSAVVDQVCVCVCVCESVCDWVCD